MMLLNRAADRAAGSGQFKRRSSQNLVFHAPPTRVAAAGCALGVHVPVLLA